MTSALPEYRSLIRDMPTDERPRERLRSYGASALSNAELMAIILRTGVRGENVINLATRILSRFDGLPGLARASFGEICKERALGEAKTAQLLAALELGKRLVSTQPGQRVTVRSPEDVSNLLAGDMAFFDQEHLRVVLLNTRNQVMAVPEVYKGNVNTAVVRVGELFKDAVREGCPALIVVHNHPSGDPTPSPDDVAITRQMVEAGALLGIDVLDHIVIGQQGYVSLKERGLGFK